MRDRDARVERVHELTRIPPDRAADVPGRPESYLEVRFESGTSGLLDMAVHRGGVWADVLRSLQHRKEPAYIEIDPQTGLITELLLPRPFIVGRIVPTEDGLDVELIISHAPHRLRRSNPDFDELGDRLHAARERETQVLVTETDDNEIVDVRPLDEPTEALL